MFRIVCGVFAVVMLAVAAGPGAYASDAELLGQLKDRAEIEELMWRYVRALDSLDEEAYAAVFTEDGEFINGRDVTKGRAALKQLVADVKKRRAERQAKGEPARSTYHAIANHYIEFIDKDRARYHSYWMTFFSNPGPGQPPSVAAMGRGVDDLVRVNGKWLIKSRNVAPQDGKE